MTHLNRNQISQNGSLKINVKRTCTVYTYTNAFCILYSKTDAWRSLYIRKTSERTRRDNFVLTGATDFQHIQVLTFHVLDVHNSTQMQCVSF